MALSSSSPKKGKPTPETRRRRSRRDSSDEDRVTGMYKSKVQVVDKYGADHKKQLEFVADELVRLRASTQETQTGYKNEVKKLREEMRKAVNKQETAIADIRAQQREYTTTIQKWQQALVDSDLHAQQLRITVEAEGVRSRQMLKEVKTLVQVVSEREKVLKALFESTIKQPPSGAISTKTSIPDSPDHLEDMEVDLIDFDTDPVEPAPTADKGKAVLRQPLGDTIGTTQEDEDDMFVGPSRPGSSICASYMDVDSLRDVQKFLDSDNEEEEVSRALVVHPSNQGNGILRQALQEDKEESDHDDLSDDHRNGKVMPQPARIIFASYNESEKDVEEAQTMLMANEGHRANIISHSRGYHRIEADDANDTSSSDEGPAVSTVSKPRINSRDIRRPKGGAGPMLQSGKNLTRITPSLSMGTGTRRSPGTKTPIADSSRNTIVDDEDEGDEADTTLTLGQYNQKFKKPRKYDRSDPVLIAKNKLLTAHFKTFFGAKNDAELAKRRITTNGTQASQIPSPPYTPEWTRETGDMDTEWNFQLATLFFKSVAEDLNEYFQATNKDDEAYATERFMARLKRIQGRYIKEDPKRSEGKHQRRRDLQRPHTRRKTLYDTRRAIVKENINSSSRQEQKNIWKNIGMMVDTLGADGQSSDESGRDEQGGRIYVVKKMSWRSPAVLSRLKVIDDDRNKTNGYGNSPAGRVFRDRKRQGTKTSQETVRRPIAGLPHNFYDPKFLDSLSPRERQKLDPGEPFAFVQFS
ncbi:hypothetical protein CVT24_007137, partial [Panaeolus cyanescens]